MTNKIIATQPPVTRIVGIGASAGGLVALEQFFENVPPASDLAYIVVQHLDPTKKALLAELLQRVTTLAVCEARALMTIEPNCVYVIPPNTELSVGNGMLKLEAPSELRGMRLPINVLFSSLARDRGDQAIAVILSGMGSDGTLGMQAIKALGGLTAVQQPDTAQFDSMPRSAIVAGYADIIAPAAELPDRIFAYITAQKIAAQQFISEQATAEVMVNERISAELMDAEATAAETSAAEPAPETIAKAGSTAPVSALQDIFNSLRQRTKHDFSLYKLNTLKRRIERRMAIHSIATLQQYADFLRQNPQETDLLFKELLIGVTSFFRDAEVWQYLAEHALPELLARRGPQDQKLRAWIAGCSTGEEAYSLAMVFAETVQRLPEYREHTLQIFASDLSPDAIAAARRGRYPLVISGDVSAARLAQFFTAHEDCYQINAQIREMVLFAEQDVVLDPPFTKLDLLSCRNLMIYFDPTLQRQLLPLFHYSLRAGGVLLLGSSETVGQFNRQFVPLEQKLRIYQRQNNPARINSDFLSKSFPPLSTLKKDPAVTSPPRPALIDENIQQAADHVLLQIHAPPAVVINPAGDIIYISGRTGKYLEPAAGKANWNFHAMVREGLRAPIAEALDQAIALREQKLLRGLKVPVTGGIQSVDVTVHPLQEPSALHDMVMIVFHDVAAVPASRHRRMPATIDAQHEVELQQLRDEIYTLRETTRASKEELQSTNEELQSTNEELQSANEELTTSKEEMQSMNEELQTINAEMQTKLDDLALAQSDMKNLLNSTDIAIVFLSQDLNVRRYTDRAAKIINLRESDIGRPFGDITTTLQYPELHADTLETLHTLKFSEKQIPATDKRWFNVRIMPYRRLDNVIDGAVITFVDITATKELESKLRQGL